jgi:hypothetical protein
MYKKYFDNKYVYYMTQRKMKFGTANVYSEHHNGLDTSESRWVRNL